jgi:hypothetical protein
LDNIKQRRPGILAERRICCEGEPIQYDIQGQNKYQEVNNQIEICRFVEYFHFKKECFCKYNINICRIEVYSKQILVKLGSYVEIYENFY